MKKEWMILGFVLIIVIFAGFYFFKNPNVVKEIPSGDYNIEINNFAFAPQELIVKVGSTVVWNNKDSVKHTVTSDSGTELGSELLGNGESYSHTFNNVGTFEYHCTPHPSMTGKIIVE
ncbi:MAG: Blue (Type 1) copper protein [archaeon GW2011_AR13]|nr:MAG: Blue (Type 1) copper protein [archaeon GW2011_AR13]HIG94367.1 cupredoxin family copper-binding protein [Nanoarchaeota archaeon]HIH63663.1 cupredoxin family copper-binding protein [Nanoarchaeota archaeon]HIJ10082.1 cupredoxin family copper-binding protein [Nanoarchaeota archaeon]